jgi:ABC-type glycerol-3-phosphate transport system permease component
MRGKRLRRYVRRKRLRRYVIFGVLVVLTILVNVPILTMILNSLKSNQAILSSTGIQPSDLTLKNYSYLSSRTLYWTWFKNSVIVALFGTAASIAIAALAGYALSRFSSRFLGAYSRTVLMFQMFPVILALIPIFILFVNLGLINNPLSVIIFYTSAHLPFAIWMYKAFMDSIPKELEEAAWIDGCSRLQGFLRIVLPISGPGIAAVAIFSFLFSWNEFLIASLFLPEQSAMTLPVGVQMFMQQFSTDWGSLMAAATLTMIPTFVLFLFVQKYMVSGAVAGSVKG